MSLLQRIFGPYTGAQSSLGWGVAGATYSGEKISVEKALGLPPVWTAISQIAGSVAMMPLIVYRRSGDYREREEGDSAWRLLHDEPNPEMAADEFWEIASSHMESWGNAFAWKRPDPEFPASTGQLWPLDPSRVLVSRNSETREREFWIEGERFTEDTILHIRALSLDGLVGYSPIQLLRNSIANAQAQERFQGRFLNQDGKPAVILRHPNKLKPEAKQHLKESFDEAKAGGTAVLQEDIQVERWTMPLEDAQFIEQMEFSDKRIAQMFNIPPARIGAKTGDSLTYATTESAARDFLTTTLQRRLNRIEKAINRDRSIITRSDLYCEFLADALLRANTKERYEAYETGRRAGFLTVEDIRVKENLPELQEPPEGEIDE